MPLHPTSWRSILILSSHLSLSIQSGFFPSGLPTKTLYAPLFSPQLPHIPPITFFLIFHFDYDAQIQQNIIWVIDNFIK